MQPVYSSLFLLEFGNSIGQKKLIFSIVSKDLFTETNRALNIYLNDLNFLCLRPFLSFTRFKQNACSFGQSFKTTTLYRTEMDKIIFATAFNKTKALAFIKPFYFAAKFVCHFCFPFDNLKKLY